MSWEVAKEKALVPTGASGLSPAAEKAKVQVKALQAAVAALRAQFSREQNSKSVHEQFALLREQAASCGQCIRQLAQTQAYTAAEREVRSRAISSLTGLLQEELRKIETFAFDLVHDDKLDLSDQRIEAEPGDQADMDFEEALIRDRREELAAVEASMNAIQGMLVDTAKLVRDQGEVIDRIDVNMGEAVTNTGKATDELHTTEKRQKTKRAILCILIFGLLIAIVVIIVLVTQTK